MDTKRITGRTENSEYVELEPSHSISGGLYVRANNSAGARGSHFTREQVVEIRDALNEWLGVKGDTEGATTFQVGDKVRDRDGKVFFVTDPDLDSDGEIELDENEHGCGNVWRRPDELTLVVDSAGAVTLKLSKEELDSLYTLTGRCGGPNSTYNKYIYSAHRKMNDLGGKTIYPFVAEGTSYPIYFVELPKPVPTFTFDERVRYNGQEWIVINAKSSGDGQIRLARVDDGFNEWVNPKNVQKVSK